MSEVALRTLLNEEAGSVVERMLLKMLEEHTMRLTYYLNYNMKARKLVEHFHSRIPRKRDEFVCLFVCRHCTFATESVLVEQDTLDEGNPVTQVSL